MIVDAAIWGTGTPFNGQCSYKSVEKKGDFSHYCRILVEKILLSFCTIAPLTPTKKSWHNGCVWFLLSFEETNGLGEKKLRILLLIFSLQNCICSKSEKRIFLSEICPKKIVRTQFEMLVVKFGVLNDSFFFALKVFR